ncbi:MAG: amino acid permease, partial [Bacteroidetes bacterium]|nr:amino acid permease [Bacteroidota bacterium]
IFVLPGLAAAKTGPSVWLAYVLAGVCVLPAALSKSELATAMPSSGGTYIYIERTFGPIFGTIAGFGLWLSLLLKSSFALVGFGAYLLVLTDVPLKPTSLALLGVIILLNVLGAKKVGKVQIFVVSSSLIGLAAILFSGLIQVDPANLEPAFTQGSSGFLLATGFVFVSYAGVTKVAAIAGEVINPGRNLPRGMILALILISIVYGFIVFALVGNVPVSQLETDLHPIYTLAETLGGKIAGIGAAILGVVTLTSMANSGVLAASRFPFAMSRDKLLPPILKRLHQQFMTPVVSIFLTGLVMALAIIFLEVEGIAKLASAFMVMMFISVNGAVIVLRETAVQWYKPEYNSPLYPWMQLFGIISGIILLILLGGLALVGAIVIIFLGLIMFFLYGKNASSRKGVLKLYGRRTFIVMLYNRRLRGRLIRSALKPPNPKDSSLNASNNLDGLLAKEAAVVVPLYGKERSPEMLVEMGAALARGRKTQVVHITEVPYQTLLDGLSGSDEVITSLNRRIAAMAEEKRVEVEFDAAVTHELVDTVHAISEQTHCKWMVMGWSGRAANGLLVRNPVGWLITHLSCNLALFKDSGVRYIRKIMIYPEPGLSDKLVSLAIDRVSTFYGAEITFVRVIPKDATEDEEAGQRKYLSELQNICKIKSESKIYRGDDPIETIVDISVGYDLLVTGPPHESNLFNVIVGTGKDKLTERAVCSVLRISEPSLQEYDPKRMHIGESTMAEILFDL